MPHLADSEAEIKVVITGASRGIGFELARQYAQAGAEVWATVRDPAKGAPLRQAGVKTPLLDVTSADSVSQLASDLADVAVDVLINNAGVLGPGQQSTQAMDFDGFAHVLAVNTLGPLRVTQALTPHLIGHPGSKVAVITSRMGSLSYAKSDTVAYRASKAAVNKVTQCLATDLREHGVAVAAIHPGWVRTNIGGQDADIDTVTSATGIRSLLEALGMPETGCFWNYDGAVLSW